MRKRMFPNTLPFESDDQSGLWLKLEIPRGDFNKEKSDLRIYSPKALVCDGKEVIFYCSVSLAISNKRYQVNVINFEGNLPIETLQNRSEELKRVLQSSNIIGKIRTMQLSADISKDSGLDLSQVRNVSEIQMYDIIGRDKEVGKYLKDPTKVILLEHVDFELTMPGGAGGDHLNIMPIRGGNKKVFYEINNTHFWIVVENFYIRPQKDDTIHLSLVPSSNSGRLDIVLGSFSRIHLIDYEQND